MTLKEFEQVNTALKTNYTIRDRTKAQTVKIFTVDYSAPYIEWSNNKNVLNSFIYAKVTSVDVFNGCLDVAAEIVT